MRDDFESVEFSTLRFGETDPGKTKKNTLGPKMVRNFRALFKIRTCSKFE